jgi:hypothetical protein
MTNATYKECPISKVDPTSNTTVMVHNPSSSDAHTLRIAVPKNNYAAEAFNFKSGLMENVASTIDCYTDTEFYQPNVEFESCWLTIQVTTEAHSYQLLNVRPVKSEKQSNKDPITLGSTISSKNMSVSFVGFDSDQSLLKFNMTNLQTMSSDILSVSLKWWDSWINNNVWGGDV